MLDSFSSESNTLKCSFMNAFVTSRSDNKRLMNTSDLVKAEIVLQNIFTLVSYLWIIKIHSWKTEINDLLRYNTIVIFQNNLHAVSIKEGSMFAVDITSGSYIYIRKFDSFQPFAITVYDSDSTGPFTG